MSSLKMHLLRGGIFLRPLLPLKHKKSIIPVADAAPKHQKRLNEIPISIFFTCSK